jgi:hypothetical protein
LEEKYQMLSQIEELHLRLDKLEKQKDQEVLALVEILSNATFFGELRKANCQYAMDGQCALFVLQEEAKNKIPIVSECRIKQCEESAKHFHIELSNITCTLCQEAEAELLSSSPTKKTKIEVNSLEETGVE